MNLFWTDYFIFWKIQRLHIKRRFILNLWLAVESGWSSVLSAVDGWSSVLSAVDSGWSSVVSAVDSGWSNNRYISIVDSQYEVQSAVDFKFRRECIVPYNYNVDLEDYYKKTKCIAQYSETFTASRFEPVREDPIEFKVKRLIHSAIYSS